MNWIKKTYRKQENKCDNPYSLKVSKCNGRRFVISDIHGCLNTFKTLINKLDLKDSDQLFLLGDYIDRGTDSKGVLDLIIELKQIKQVYPIRGNHEDDLLNLLEFNSDRLIGLYIEKEKGQTLFDQDYIIEDKYINFINDLPYFIELESVILVHAGFDFRSSKPYENYEEMVWIRNFDYDKKLTKGKKIIHGHTPHPLKEIMRIIRNNENIIPLDNGCVFPKVDYGNLLCLNIDTNQLMIQENVDDY